MVPRVSKGTVILKHRLKNTLFSLFLWSRFCFDDAEYNLVRQLPYIQQKHLEWIYGKEIPNSHVWDALKWDLCITFNKFQCTELHFLHNLHIYLCILYTGIILTLKSFSFWYFYEIFV